MELLIIELLGRWKMKKLTVRVEDYVYDRLFLVKNAIRRYIFLKFSQKGETMRCFVRNVEHK